MDYDYYFPLPPPLTPPIVVAEPDPIVGVSVNQTYIPLGSNNMTLPSLQPSINPDMASSTLQNIQVDSSTVPFSGNTSIVDVGISSISQSDIIGVQPNPTFAGNTPIYATNDAVSQAVSQWSLFPAVSVVYASTISTNTMITNSLSAQQSFMSSIVNNHISTLEIDTGNIFASFIDIDGQILTADPDQLFLNGLPIATTASLSTIADWAIYDAVSTIRMSNNNITEANEIYSDIVSTNICQASLLNADYIDANYIQTNYAQVSSMSGILGSFDEVDVSTLQLNSGVGVGQLSVDAPGTTLFFNNAPITTGNPASNWSAYPATGTVDFALNTLSSIGNFSMSPSISKSFNLGGGTILTPINANKQYSLTTNIVSTSPVTPMEISAGGGMNITATAVSGAQEFNITLIGSGNDMNITAPDINLLCTDPTSFMNLTAPAGVTIAGGGLFIASGVLEAIGAGDIKLLSGGNVQIGSGNLLGATTQLEKFEFTDCNVEPMNGVNNLRLINCQISNVRRDAGGAGVFPGNFAVRCEQNTTYTIQSYNSNAQQTIWSVTADDGSNVSKAMNLQSLGSNQPIRFNMTANGNVFTTTYNSGNTVSYTTTGGDALLAGIGTINASLQLSAPTISATTINALTGNISTLQTQQYNVSSITGEIGTFSDLFINNPKIHLGSNAGIGQGNFTVAVGDGAGQTSQGLEAVSVGSDAGNASQGAGAVAIGVNAGAGGQGTFAVAVGANSGFLNQSPYSLAIGTGAGNIGLGSNSVAIGTSASANGGSFPNTLVINGSGATLNPVASNSLYIKPLRNVTTQPGGTANAMGYTTSTGEVVVANTSINEIESTIHNTQQITYDEGILTTAIDGLLQVNGQAQFTQTVAIDTTLNVLETANISSLKLYGIPATSYPNTLLYNSTTKDVSFFPTASVIPAVTVSQNVFYVAKGGSDTTGNGQSYNPYLTIQKAIDMCPVGAQDVGQTIYIMAGLYVEDLSIADKNINFRGSGDTNHTYNTTIRGNMTITSSDTNRSYRTVSFQFVQIQNFTATTGKAITLSTTGTGKGKLVLSSCYVIGASTGVSLIDATASNCSWIISMDATRLYTGQAYSAPLINIGGANGTAVDLQMNNCLLEYESPAGSTNSILKVDAYSGATLQYCTVSQPLNGSFNNSALTNGLIWMANTANGTATNVLNVGSTLLFSGTQATLGIAGTSAIFCNRNANAVYVLGGTISVRSNSTPATHCIVGAGGAGTRCTVFYATGNLVTTFGTANKIDNSNCLPTTLTTVS